MRFNGGARVTPALALTLAGWKPTSGSKWLDPLLPFRPVTLWVALERQRLRERAADRLMTKGGR